MNTLREIIQETAKLLSGMGQQTLYEFVNEHGIEFKPTDRPAWMKQATPKECFKNALELSLITGLIYVEGYTFRHIPIHHAWCVDEENNVFDNTIADPGDCEYFGIPMDSDFVVEVVDKTEMYGILDNWKYREIYKLHPSKFIHPEWYKPK